MKLKKLLDYIHSQQNHFRESIQDPFFYVCLIAIYDSERFYRELPGIVSTKNLFQTLWFSADIFHAIKYPLLYLSLIFLAVATLLFIFTKKKRATYSLLFLGYFISSFIHFHYFQLYHRSHLLMYALLIMAIYTDKSRRPKAIDLIQGLTLAIYSLAGFWKLFFILKEVIKTHSFSFLQDVFPRHIAHFFMFDFEFRVAGQSLIDHPGISMFLFLGVMGLQIASLAVYRRKRLYPLWAVGILSFHYGTFYFLNILFWQMILIVIIFFLVPNKWSKCEVQNV